jgi:hypothetical protein
VGRTLGFFCGVFVCLVACTSVNGKVLESRGQVLYCGKLSFPVQS